MAGEPPGDASGSVDLPESVRSWLDEVSQVEGPSRPEVLLQLLSASRQTDGGEPEGELTVGAGDEPPGEAAADLRADIASMIEAELQAREASGRRDEATVDSVLDSEAFERRLEAAVAERLDDHLDERIEATVADHLDDSGGLDEDRLDERVGAVEDRFTELLEDVRERVIQVKREADAKAPADHDHEDLAAAVAAVEDDLAELSTAVEELDADLHAGFDNFESVLTHVEESTGELRARQTTLARALVETRDELRSLAAREERRAAADELRRTANRHGVSSGTCADCGSTVDLGLLSAASCPHCSATFVDVDPSSGLFGKTVLETGDRPALEPGDADEGGYEVGVADMIDEERSGDGGGQS